MYKRFIKRFFDIIFAVLGMPVFFIILIVAAPIIYLEDKGPVFYNAERLGKNGKIFKMYKFRSMYVNSPDIRNPDGSTYNGEEDPRVTKFGRFIRKTSIDEIPQIINVLLGQMSFVGPRPDLPDIMDIYSEEDKLKLTVRPGVTGYNQVYFRNSLELPARFKNDIYYIYNISFMTDFKIMIKTVIAVISRKNVYIPIKSQTAQTESVSVSVIVSVQEEKTEIEVPVPK